MRPKQCNQRRGRDLNARQPELIDLKRRDRPTLASLSPAPRRAGLFFWGARHAMGGWVTLYIICLPGPCRETATAKITPTMRLNMGRPEVGHRYHSSGGAYEHGRQPADRAVPTADRRTPDRETVGTAAPRVNQRGLSDVARGRATRPQENSRVPKCHVAGRSARFVARRIGEAQQPRCCAALLFNREGAHRHAEHSPKGGVVILRSGFRAPL